jgi:hypothetical protein
MAVSSAAKFTLPAGSKQMGARARNKQAPASKWIYTLAPQERLAMKSVIKLLIFAGICILCYRWDSIIDSLGTAVPGSITEKREHIRTNYADWFRRFEIVAAFQASGYANERHAICDVDEPIFDSLHVGSPVTVHYLPGLLQIPLVTSTHISSCPPWGMFGFNPELYRRSLYLYGSLAIIVGLVFVLRMRRALWLLLPWSAWFVFYGMCPHTEPIPLQPRPITAVVKEVATVKTLVDTGTTDAPPIRLAHPYQLVQMEYTPEGRSEPVLAIDAIDPNSVPNLGVGRMLNVDYDAGNPRIASIPGATRMFRQQAMQQLGLLYFTLLALLLVLLLFARRSLRSRKRTLR